MKRTRLWFRAGAFVEFTAIHCSESRSQEGIMRYVIALLGMALISAGGCRMCASPYDYCGPVIECDDPAHPAMYTTVPTNAVPETVPTPQAKPQMQTPVPSPGPQSEMPQASRTRPSMRQARARRPHPYNDQTSDATIPQAGQVYER